MTLTRSAVTRLVAGMLLAVGLVGTGAPAQAAPPTSVDFTVEEALPVVTPGTFSGADIPGCPSGTVDTTSATATPLGSKTRFSGTKVIDCGASGTITIEFRATSAPCWSEAVGRWKIVSGTGSYASAKGGGALIGSYTLGAGAGDFCTNDGIDDRYIGKIKL